MKLSVIILNWNGKNLLKRFLPSVVDFTSDFDIYLVDNNSEDNSIEFAKNNFPEINIIKLSKNYGYAEGYNIAIEQIESDIYCFLNSDVRVTKNWTKPIIKIFKNNPLITIIQPKILMRKTLKTFRCCRRISRLDMYYR